MMRLLYFIGLSTVYAERAPMTAALLASNLKQGIVIDVGANGGLETELAVKFQRRVVAFECLSTAYSSLVTMFAHTQKVKIYHACVGERLKLASLHLAHDSSSMLENNIKHGRELEKAKTYGTELMSENAIVVPLDHVISTPVALIKIDVQGNEAAVLRGAQQIIKLYKPVILYENEVAFEHAGNPLNSLAGYSCRRIGVDNLCVPE